MPTDARSKVSKSLVSLGTTETIPALVERARQGFGDERRVAATELNAYLRSLTHIPSRQSADVLLAALEGNSLDGLVGEDGTRCRTVAAESLLALGYPYALEISPEHLDRLRREQATGSARPSWNAAMISWALAFALLSFFIYWFLAP